MVEFLAGIASAERSQARLSVAALTAACCAAQLEAQCREVLRYREQAPGPEDIAGLITSLQRLRARLVAFGGRASDVEYAATRAQELPDTTLEERLRKQSVREKALADFLKRALDAAALLASLGNLARRVHAVRREVRGGRPSQESTFVQLAAASCTVLDVVERTFRLSRSRDPRLRAQAFRASARLRPLCLVPTLDDEDLVAHTLSFETAARRN